MTYIKRIVKHFIKYHPTMTFELIPEYPFFREIERLTEDDKKQLKNAFSGFDFGKITRVNLEEKEEKEEK